MSINEASNPIYFSGTISKSDFLRVQAMLLPLWARWYVTATCVLFVFVSTGVGWSVVFSKPLSLIPDLIYTVILMIALAAMNRYMLIRNWRKMISLSGDVRGIASDWGIEWANENTTSKFEWAKFIRIQQKPDLTLVHYSSRCAFYFPRTFFESDTEWQRFNEIAYARIEK